MGALFFSQEHFKKEQLTLPGDSFHIFKVLRAFFRSENEAHSMFRFI